MKRRDLLRHLEKQGCEFLREGGNHTIYVNRCAQTSSAVPHHREIIEFLAQKNLQRSGHSEAVDPCHSSRVTFPSCAAHTSVR